VADTFLGVTTDRVGKRQEYHVAEELNEFGSFGDSTPIAVRNADGVRQVFHVYNPKRVNATRGVTQLAPVFSISGMLEDINFAKLVQQQVVSCFAVFRKMAAGGNRLPSADSAYGDATIETTQAGTRQLEGVSPGMEVIGQPGEELQGFSPNVPNSEYFQQVKLILQIIGVNFGLPLCLVLMDGSETNFSGWRGAVDEARKGFVADQMNLVRRLNKGAYKWRLWWDLQQPRSEFRKAFSEIGDVIFKFDIEDAIKRGILVEFDYIALKYQLTQDDKNRKRSVYASQSIRRGTSNPMSSEELARELAKVYKLSKSKIPTFADFLRNEENNKILESCIIFVQQEDYGSEVLEILHTYTNNYRTYYSNDSEEILKEFAKENIDVLITCKKLSQGIDIPSLRNIVIFSSDKEKLVTIQRLGRCIRFDPNNPNKRAKVVDFYEDSNADESYDQKRYDWLTELSKTKLEG
jgi:hypothetical protein